MVFPKRIQCKRSRLIYHDSSFISTDAGIITLQTNTKYSRHLFSATWNLCTWKTLGSAVLNGSPKMPCGKSLRLSSSTAANLAHNRCSMHSEHTLTRAHLTDHQIRTADEQMHKNNGYSLTKTKNND